MPHPITTATMASQNTRPTREAAEEAVRTLIAYTGDDRLFCGAADKFCQVGAHRDTRFATKLDTIASDGILLHRTSQHCATVLM